MTVLDCRAAGGRLVRVPAVDCAVAPAADGSFIIVYMAVPGESFELELTWLREHPQKYDLGECEFHLAFRTDDFDAAHEKHKEMGCICYENPAMGIYFIQDPDGYWIEIVPACK